MKLLAFEQQSSAWLDWRSEGLGASDAPAVVGCSPYTSPTQLWEQKYQHAGSDASTYAQRRGQRLEPIARRLYQERTGILVRPACAEHDDYPWLKWSSDGLTFAADAACEVKCLRLEAHRIACAGSVPLWYRPQLDHALLVSGLDAIDYVSYSEHSACLEADRLAIVAYHADPRRLAAYLETAQAFWWHVQKGIPLTDLLRTGARFKDALMVQTTT